MRWLTFAALVALATFSALNWRAQVQTQQKFDSLSAALAERASPATPPTAPAPAQVAVPPPGAVPVELSHLTLPPYVIEPPDQLSIEVVVKDPKTGATQQLLQPISGPFLVRLDGTVGLGHWGNLSVAGMTLDQAKKAVCERVVRTCPEELSAKSVTAVVDVLAYNSKVYYVITDSAGGEQVVRLPITGNETVLDAVANSGGLAGVPSKGKIWVARPAGKSGQPARTLPVDWRGITENGVTATNYQLLPGDRVYVKHAAD
jgi:polysaccharide export outer membrane protein